jgi:hypothetical protein
MTKPGATFRLDTAHFERSVAAWVQRQAPEVADRGVRRIAFAVGGRIVRSLNGEGDSPKRIDTGRYRAAWATGTAIATGLPVAAPASTESAPGDARGTSEGRGLTRAITVENLVKYGPYVEFGTEKMQAGLHVKNALDTEGKKVEKLVGELLRQSWRR